MSLRPIHFIDEPVSVFFDHDPIHSKSPHCPDGFSWQGQEFRVVRKLSKWVDYQRRGRMARNMQPQHTAIASNRGSWGVGRFYFQVQVEGGEFFELYYDRAPKDVDNRMGSWTLVAQFEER